MRKRSGMKSWVGVIMILLGIVLGLYVGIWVMFIGGIVQIIHQIQAPHIEAMQVAIGVARILCASFVGVISAMVLVIPGVGIAFK